MGTRLEHAGPAADVAPFVAAFYDLDPHDRTDLAQIRFILGPHPAHYRLADGAVRQAPTIHVVAAAATMTMCADGPLAMFAIALTPAGWAAAVGGDPSLMADRVIDAAMLFGAGIRAALTALRIAPDRTARLPIGEAVVRALVRSGDGGARPFVRQVEDWLAASPSPDMDALAARTGLSRRQVERKCKALYGMPPKLLARKYRALRAAAAIRAGDEPFGAVIERGFYDQSHMIREIKQFTGLTPGQIRSGEAAIGPRDGTVREP